MRRGVATLAAAAAALLTVADSAQAHGFFLTPSLPIPPWLFGAAAALVVAVSFLALGALWSTPRPTVASWRPVAPGLGAALTSTPAQAMAGAVGIATWLLVIYAGLRGVQAPDDNVATAFVFAPFWVGIAILSGLLGDVFAALNPWRAVGRAARWAARRYVGDSTIKLSPLTYPERFGVAPSALGLLGFGYLELASGRTPHAVAVATIVYSLLTFLGMGLFGVDTWSRRGEAFGVYYGLLARLSPVEFREGVLGVRQPLSGLGLYRQHPAWCSCSRC